MVLSTTPQTLVALLTGQLRPDDAVVGGQLDVRGSKGEIRRFFKLFRL